MLYITGRLLMPVFFAATVLLTAALPAAAQQSDLSSLLPGSSNLTSARIIQLVLAITVLSVAPGILVMVTCFTRFIIALSFLRSGLGLPSTPANLVLISLALFMTLFTMAPTFDKAWESGVKPFMDNKLSEEEAFHKISDPFREFMTANVRQKDIDLFAAMAHSQSANQSGGTNASAHPDPCFHDLRVAAGIRDRLSDHAPVPGHRPHHRDADHVDGHDDAVTRDHFDAFQNFVLHPDRRLESFSWAVCCDPSINGKLIPLPWPFGAAKKNSGRTFFTISRKLQRR